MSGIKRLGDRIEALELGRNGSGHVANLEDTERISERERTQSLKMPDDPGTKGLEFVRAWDSAAVSMMSLTPFVLSLIFCGGWMGVSIGKLQVDAQVATQTAFTVATFIVTAGKSSSPAHVQVAGSPLSRCAPHSTLRVLGHASARYPVISLTGGKRL